MRVTTILRHEGRLTAAGLAVVSVLAWGYILLGGGMGMNASSVAGMVSGDMSGMAMGGTDTPAVWTPAHAFLVFLMWSIMMVAMMLPSATPAILLFARVNETIGASGRAEVPAGLFAAGYLAVWGGFGLVATAMQWMLDANDLISGMMASTSRSFSAGLLIAAGIWQLSPLKHACLRRCRGPMQFFQQGFLPGRSGAFAMGAELGLSCLGCCWFLMALLFVGGVMNLAWIAGLTLYVLVEKTMPGGHRIGTVAGIVCLVSGAWLLVEP